jgi:hypothetical protein
MKYTNRCQLNGKTYTMNLNCTEAQFKLGVLAYNSGMLLQNAFPFLNADEREFVKTGITPEIWAEIFSTPSNPFAHDFGARGAAPDERVTSDANGRFYGAGE